MIRPSSDLQGAVDVLAGNANAADANPIWPSSSWEALRKAGVLRWCIPTAYGGDGREGVSLLEGY
jgi:alkylation response protein AidB-like acyl-CoA dehydrogenase